MMWLSHSEDQNASLFSLPKDSHREKQPHILTVLSQPKVSETSQIPSLCLLEDGTGIQAARVESEVKGHRDLKVIYREM